MLSASQQQIIENLTTEFNKYNKLKSKKTPLSELIDISEIIFEQSEVEREKEEIRTNHIAFRNKLIEELSNYVVEITKLLSPLGFKAHVDSKNNPCITITNKNIVISHKRINLV